MTLLVLLGIRILKHSIPARDWGGLVWHAPWCACAHLQSHHQRGRARDYQPEVRFYSFGRSVQGLVCRVTPGIGLGWLSTDIHDDCKEMATKRLQTKSVITQYTRHIYIHKHTHKNTCIHPYIHIYLSIYLLSIYYLSIYLYAYIIIYVCIFIYIYV